MKVLLAIPTSGSIQDEPFFSFMQLGKPNNTAIIPLKNVIIWIARYQACKVMMDGGFDAVIMIDSDMIPEPTAMLKLLGHKELIVGAPCFKRVPPYEPCFYKTLERDEEGRPIHMPYEDWPRDRTFEVAAMGTGCIMIRRQALEKIEHPWWYPMPGSGEDTSFCWRAKEAGVKMYIDPTIRVGHLENRAIYEENYLEKGFIDTLKASGMGAKL